MPTTLYAVPFLDSLAGALGQAWTRLGQRQFEPLAIQIGRIIEAIDVPTGRKVMLDRWIGYIEARAGLSRSAGATKTLAN